MAIQDMTLDECVEKYVIARDLKADAKKVYDERAKKADEVMKKLENELLRRFAEQGIDNCKSPNGTAYKTTKSSASVADASAFRNFVCNALAQDLLTMFPGIPAEQRDGFRDAITNSLVASDALDFFNNAANKDAVKTMLTETGELPPGVNWSEITAIGIRRS